VFFSIAITIWSLCHGREVKRAKLALHLLPVLPPIVLHMLAAIPAMPADRVWDGPFGKLKGISSLFIGYDWRVDLSLIALLVLGLVLGLRQRSERSFVDRSAALVAGAFFVAFLLAPSESNGTWALDRRFLVPAAVMALLAVRFEAPRAWPAYAMMVLATAAHLVFVTVMWWRLSGQVARQVQLIDETVPRQSRLGAITFLDLHDKLRWPRQMPFRFGYLWAVIDRDVVARGVFAYPGQQPIRELPSSAQIPAWPQPSIPPEQIAWPAIFSAYDSLFTLQLTPAYRDFLNAHCRVAGERDGAVVYRDCVATTR